ncbi:MAG: hypothetical protein ACRDOY_06720, partial [Nocardioidaceae bacterium]
GTALATTAAGPQPPGDAGPALVRRALEQYADQVPQSHVPADRAIQRYRLRRRRRVAGGTAAAAIVAVPVVWGTLADEPGPAPTRGEQSEPTRVDVSDWRWESWGGVQVHVPPDWGHADLTQWCADPGTSGPAVDRPELRSSNKLCSLSDNGRPTYTAGLLMRWSASSPRLSRVDVAPYATTRIVTLGEVTLTLVDVDSVVGDAILGSAQVIGWRDHNGCEPQQQLGGAGFLADSPNAALRGRIGPVELVSVCRYGLRGDWSGTRLISSRRVTGAAAADLVQALRAAPKTPVPDRSRRCHAPEREFAVLELWPDGVRGAPFGGPASLLLRYDGCRGHGLYDGTAVRRLTPEVMAPVLVPPWSGDIAPDLRRLVPGNSVARPR